MSDFDTTLANLGINSTGGTTGTSTSTSNTTSGSTTLGQSDFLKLLTAQLNNQDPFSPVDNTQMVAQMAQISTSSGVGDLNTTLKAISDKLSATSTSDALSYVGKTVLTAGSTAYGRTSGGIAGAVELGAAASDVKVTISDQSGNTLKTLSLGSQAAGTATYDWDGTTDSGAAAGTGPFKVSVAAQNNGTTVAATGLIWAPVESVSVPSSGSPTLSVTGIGSVAIADVRSVG